MLLKIVSKLFLVLMTSNILIKNEMRNVQGERTWKKATKVKFMACDVMVNDACHQLIKVLFPDFVWRVCRNVKFWLFCVGLVAN